MYPPPLRRRWRARARGQCWEALRVCAREDNVARFISLATKRSQGSKRSRSRRRCCEAQRDLRQQCHKAYRSGSNKVAEDCDGDTSVARLQEITIVDDVARPREIRFAMAMVRGSSLWPQQGREGRVFACKQFLHMYCRGDQAQPMWHTAVSRHSTTFMYCKIKQAQQGSGMGCRRDGHRGTTELTNPTLPYRVRRWNT